MATVDKATADKVVAGIYQKNRWKRITKYTNFWGGESYGLEDKPELNLYAPTDHVINPEVYWEK